MTTEAMSVHVKLWKRREIRRIKYKSINNKQFGNSAMLMKTFSTGSWVTRAFETNEEVKNRRER